MDERCFRKSSHLFRDLQGSRRNSFEDASEGAYYLRGSFNNNDLVKSLFTLFMHNKGPGQVPFP